jgi:hypothetical protein
VYGHVSTGKRHHLCHWSQVSREQQQCSSGTWEEGRAPVSVEPPALVSLELVSLELVSLKLVSLERNSLKLVSLKLVSLVRSRSAVELTAITSVSAFACTCFF